MNRKGVTPVVATALLIGIALSTVATAAVFMQDSFKRVQDRGQDAVNSGHPNADLSIETGYNQGGYIIVRVRNKGKTALPINKSDSVFSVYAGGRPTYDWKFLSDIKVLGAGGVVTVNTSETFPAYQNSTKIEVVGPYDTKSAIYCYNDGSSSC
ncbi:MAG: archaellin/type IV pilin N-terminal domain-containing protein [Candidatus Nanohalobium sp.]